jgi:hypothetical protein
MRLEMNSNQIACLFYDQSGSRIGYWKNSVIGFNPLFSDIFFDPGSQFLRKEDRLSFSPAFRISNDDFSILNIHWGELENLTDPHAAASHEFEHDPIPRILRPKYDFIDHIFFQNFELGDLPCFEQLSQRVIVAGILKIRIDRILDEVEENGQKGES